MHRFLIVILLGLSFSVQATEMNPHAMPSGAGDQNQNVALVGGGLLGMIVASGAVGIISSVGMMLEGGGIAEALEAGAGLPMPLAALSAILGAMFAQDFVLRNMNALNIGAHKTTAH